MGWFRALLAVQRAEVKMGQVRVSLVRLFQLEVAGMQQACYPQAQGLCLRPAAVCEGGIVGGRGGEVPGLVGGIEAGAMSGQAVSVRDGSETNRRRAHLATMTMSGPLAMLHDRPASVAPEHSGGNGRLLGHARQAVLGVSAGTTGHRECAAET